MAGPTPEQKAYIEKVVHRFERDWEADIYTLNIQRSPRAWWQKAWEWIKPPKHDIFALYWWVKYYYKKNGFLGKSPYPIRSDNTPIKGYPMKYELLGGWKIPKQDRKFLQKGPLQSEQTGEILVHFDSGIVKIKRLAREWGPLFVIANVVFNVVKILL